MIEKPDGIVSVASVGKPIRVIDGPAPPMAFFMFKDPKQRHEDENVFHGQLESYVHMENLPKELQSQIRSYLENES